MGSSQYCCKVCSRSFRSGRSLGGHMRSHVVLGSFFHAKKAAVRGEDDSWNTGVQAGEMDMQIDSEIAVTAVPGRRRQRRRRLRRLEDISASSLPQPSPPEYEYELVHGALCLMMLSRGASSVISISSDMKSVVTEDAWRRWRSDISRVGLKKVRLPLSESGFSPDIDGDDYIFNAEKKDLGSAVLEFRKNSSKRSWSKRFQSHQTLGDHCASRKKIKGDSFSRSPVTEEHIKQFFYRCPICGKAFASGQALGGHKSSHLVAVAGTNAAGAAFAVVTEIEQKRSKLNSLDLNLPSPDYWTCESLKC